jgi:hypothetical protein
MYKRDANVEMKETLERLGQAVDKFAEVHAKDRDAKDDSNKEILEFLKKGGARDVKDVPAADLRADHLLRMPRGGVAVTGSAGALDFTSFTRFNTAVRAATGDLGAFQRSIFHTAAATTRARSLTERLAVVNEAIANAPTKYRAAGDDDITKLVNFMVGRGSTPDAMTKAMNLVGKYGLPGSEKSPSGERVFEIVSDEKYAKRARAAAAWEEKGKTAKLTEEAKRLAGQAANVQTAVRLGITAAAVALPVVAAKMINKMSDDQIKAKRPLAAFDGQLAHAYAQYDVNRIMTNIRHAQGISGSMSDLLKSRAAFERTVEPIQTLADNAKNTVLATGTRIQTSIIKPFALMADRLNKVDAGQHAANVGMELAFHSIRSIFPAAGPLRFFHEKMQDVIKAEEGKAGIPLMDFSKSIYKKANICPAQRFVP